MASIAFAAIKGRSGALESLRYCIRWETEIRLPSDIVEEMTRYKTVRLTERQWAKVVAGLLNGADADSMDYENTKQWVDEWYELANKIREQLSSSASPAE